MRRNMDAKKELLLRFRHVYEDDIVEFLDKEQEETGVSLTHIIREAIRYYRDNKKKLKIK